MKPLQSIVIAFWRVQSPPAKLRLALKRPRFSEVYDLKGMVDLVRREFMKQMG